MYKKYYCYRNNNISYILYNKLYKTNNFIYTILYNGRLFA